MTPVSTIATFRTSPLFVVAISSSNKITSIQLLVFRETLAPSLLPGSDCLFHVLGWLCTRNRAASTQTVDFVISKTELFQDFIIVLTDFRSASGRHFGNTVHLNRTVDGRSHFLAGSCKRNDDVIRSQLRIIHDFLWVTHGAEGAVNAVEDLIPTR